MTKETIKRRYIRVPIEEIEVTPERKASKVLGILSICLFWLTYPSIILSIIGLCIKKSEEHKARDIALNVVGLVLSILWTLWLISMF